MSPRHSVPPLLLLLLCSTTPLALAAGQTVTHLPGFPGPLPFHLETGYVGVNDVDLFYYFIRSQRNPAEDPLLLWLTGGPGCSVFSALAYQIGPITFRRARYNGSLPSLMLNPYPWTDVANIIFVDSPAGVGFSFSKSTSKAVYSDGDMSSSIKVDTFLRKWLDDHPEFISNPFYVGGDSYAGKLVPIVTHLISEGNRAGDKLHVNLKGYLAGNPYTGDRMDFFAIIPFLHGMGIISDELYESTMKACEGQYYEDASTEECSKHVIALERLRTELNEEYILEPRCTWASPRPKGIGGERRSLQVYNGTTLLPPSVPDVGCRQYGYYLSYYWANNDLVKEALHIRKGTVDEWQRCNNHLYDQYIPEVKNVVMYHFNLTSKGYRALIYSGDRDSTITFHGTQAWIRSLNFSIVDDWRSWIVDGQVGGYTRTYSNNMTFATVKDAGHTAPEYRRKECLAMVRRWLSHKPL